MFGIIVVNVLIFQYGLHHVFDKNSLGILDYSVYGITKILFDSTFLPLFALLFGFSFHLFYEAAERKGFDSKKLIIRRSLFLIFIGCLHFAFLWEGDILLYYGIASLILYGFINKSNKVIVIVSLLFIGLLLLLPFTTNSTDVSLAVTDFNQKANTVYSNGSYFEILKFKLAEGLPLFETLQDTIVLIVGMLYTGFFFFIGLYLSKVSFFKRSNKTNHKKLALLTVLGLILKSYAFLMTEQTTETSLFLHLVGSSLLTLGYTGLFCLIYYKWQYLKIFNYLEKVGRTSLSNYLLQSLVMCFVFYGYGIALFSKLGVLNGFLVACTVYIIQVILSIWYLSKFKLGPIEFLMKKVIYCKINKR